MLKSTRPDDGWGTALFSEREREGARRAQRESFEGASASSGVETCAAREFVRGAGTKRAGKGPDSRLFASSLEGASGTRISRVG